MDCHEVKNSLPAFLEADLQQEDESIIRLHLDNCTACKAELEVLQASWDILGQWKAEEPARDFEQKFWTKIAEVETSKSSPVRLDRLQKWLRSSRSQRWWKTSWVPLGSLAAAAMVLITIWIFRSSSPGVTGFGEQTASQQEEAAMVEMLSSLSILEHDELIENMELLENFELLLSLEEMSREKDEKG